MNVRLNRGLGLATPTMAECMADTLCRVNTDVLCYGPLAWTEKCAKWRNFDPSVNEKIPFSLPPAVKLPPDWQNAGAWTEEQAQQAVNAMIDEQAAAAKAQIAKEMADAAAAGAAVAKEKCFPWETWDEESAECKFNFFQPAPILLTAVVVVGILVLVKVMR